MIKEQSYNTSLVCNVTKATENQLKYWVKNDVLNPVKIGKKNYYSFREILKIKLIINLKNNGLSFQKIMKGFRNLCKELPENESVLSKLIIYTDGFDMIVFEKGQYYSALTKQKYLKFDTELLKSEVIKLKFLDNYTIKNYKRQVNL